MKSKYITIKLPSGDEADILDVRTGDVMVANLKAAAKNESPLLLYYLICEVVFINGGQVTMDILNNMLVADSSMIIEAINNQMIKISAE